MNVPTTLFCLAMFAALGYSMAHLAAKGEYISACVEDGTRTPDECRQLWRTE